VLFPVRAISTFSSSPRRSKPSARFETAIARHLSLNNSCQQPRLHLQNPPVIHPITKQRMRHQRIHTLLVSADKSLPPGRLQAYR